MSIKKVGTVGGALIVRLTVDLRELGIKLGDNVNVTVEGDEIIIRKEEERKS